MNIKQSQKEYLKKVVFLMKNSYPDLLNAQMKTNRARVLNYLNEYAERGIYAADESEKITPIFKNEKGVYCALGHLLVETGEIGLAEEISNENNYIDVEEISSFENTKLGAWARLHGIDRSETIIIQRYAPHKGRKT
jgi:hypothetical protein